MQELLGDVEQLRGLRALQREEPQVPGDAGLTLGVTRGPGGQKRPLALGQGAQFSQMDFSGRFLGKAQQLLPTPLTIPDTTLPS